MALELVVVTPEGEAFSETVDQVVLPGEAGEFGVLESHERFLTPLLPGPMEVKSGGNSRWAALSGGFAEVDGSRVVVLVDACALASEIDRAQVEADCSQAQEAFSDLAATDENAGERARLADLIARADVKLSVTER